MNILDMSAGNRAIWFNKRNPLCVYIDKRKSVKPDIVMNSMRLKFPDKTFRLIVFDPPHVNFGKNSRMSKSYGHTTTAGIRKLIAASAREAHRVSKRDALMVFKWNDHDQKLPTILKLMSKYWQPLFGHLTKDGPGSKTYWCLLRKIK